MIISASRRTDIPAFYAPWFIQRVREGRCWVPNPFNKGQVSEISLDPAQVDAIVFWTRNPRPLFPYLEELDERGFRYYFQYTLMDNPPAIDQHNPPAAQSIHTFRSLAERIGPERLIWRYDPIVLSEITRPDFHQATFARLAAALRGASRRSVISFMDFYPKLKRRLEAMQAQGARLLPEAEGLSRFEPESLPKINFLARSLAEIADQNGMEMVSCAEELDLEACGIRHGKCIDDDLLLRVFGLEVAHAKDPSQRKACGCVASKDIGMYDSCLFGCRYCYATSSFERARANYRSHDPHCPSLL
jgi:hypothetical protein